MEQPQESVGTWRVGTPAVVVLAIVVAMLLFFPSNILTLVLDLSPSACQALLGQLDSAVRKSIGRSLVLDWFLIGAYLWLFLQLADVLAKREFPGAPWLKAKWIAGTAVGCAVTAAFSDVVENWLVLTLIESESFTQPLLENIRVTMFSKWALFYAATVLLAPTFLGRSSWIRYVGYGFILSAGFGFLGAGVYSSSWLQAAAVLWGLALGLLVVYVIISAFRPALSEQNAEPTPEDDPTPLDQVLKAELRALQHTDADPLSALCLSGGGIRSATFNLGVLQGLAARGVLEKLDYLSTVSGGGYIGGWLSSWIVRHPEGISGVTRELNELAPRRLDPSAEPLRRLREYSNYLTPQWGLLSADTWTFVAIYLRNLLLNWLILLPLLAALLALPRLVAALTQLRPDNIFRDIVVALTGSRWEYGLPSVLVLLLGAFLTIWAISYVAMYLPSTNHQSDTLDSNTQGNFLRQCLLPLVVAAFAFSIAWAWMRNTRQEQELPALIWFAGFGALVHVLAGLFAWYHVRSKRSALAGKSIPSETQSGQIKRKGSLTEALRDFVIIVVAGVIGGVLVGAMAGSPPFRDPRSDMTGYYVSFAPPLLLVLYFAATSLYVGLASYRTSDADREWWARSGGWLLIVAVVWSVASWLVLFGPVQLQEEVYGKMVSSLGGVAGAITLLLGRSSLTGGTKKEEEQQKKVSWLETILNNAPKLAAPIFAAFIVIMLSLGTNWLLSVLARTAKGLPSAPTAIVCPSLGSFSGYRWECRHLALLYTPLDHQYLILQSPLLLLLGLVLFFVALGLYMGRCVNINKFSLHAAYRDRLIRAYLGASRKEEERTPTLFTGFDPADNLPIYELHPAMLRRDSFKDFDSFLANLGTSSDSIPSYLREQFSKETRGLLDEYARPVVSELKTVVTQELNNLPQKLDEDTRADVSEFKFKLKEVVTHELNNLLQTDVFQCREAFQTIYLACTKEMPELSQQNPKDDSRILLNRLLLERAFPENIEKFGEQKSKLLPVINIALNLVRGTNLAWQERKAESFTVSPLHVGNCHLGYRCAGEYGGTKGEDGGSGISLGTAMAISGAAVSPNSGYNSSPVVTFLLSLFNFRLGWWLGNPGKQGTDCFRRRGPEFAVGPLIAETFGLTDDESRYVYLSDGGHFDNLGLYEMVLRRCRLIIVSDAGCDPQCDLADLGGAIRKIRADFGVPVEFKEFKILPREKDTRMVQDPGARVAVGTIRYSEVNKNEPDGVLIYLKPAFYGGDEPKDVFNYGQEHKDFPHETTADQWFSESQFESYRVLGYHTVQELVSKILPRIPGGFVEVLTRQAAARNISLEYTSSQFTCDPRSVDLSMTNQGEQYTFDVPIVDLLPFSQDHDLKGATREQRADAILNTRFQVK